MAKSYRSLAIPAGVEVKVQPGQVAVKGKLGALVVNVLPGLTVKVADGQVVVDCEPSVPRVHVGSLRAHIGNAFVGVTQGYQKVLELRGMGYKAQKTKEGVQVSCGFSHPVDFSAPAGVTMDVSQVPDPDDTKLQMFEIVVRGSDRHVVGQLAAVIHGTKPPDVYRGKGIRYKGQHVRKKQGKRAAGTQTA
ncbi:50S ribosomal protein L6 [candidate division WOR-3 bacterium]|uniref:50S ribosomal protein L6 n=1 Tax=candidate division WOR-3 bacterium TaxID=2052148 RepID=A0A937XDE1_UNCW3|nr:50S ribosomal protein L6 [candidate division WOR-3 bacterium]